MANTDWFRIDIKGVSAHGSMPHKGIDALSLHAKSSIRCSSSFRAAFHRSSRW
jgi:metal-dependent amidase/aminoacylase/carboxypeptidase family protein